MRIPYPPLAGGTASQEGRNPIVALVAAELRVCVAQLTTPQPVPVPLCIRPGLPVTLAALPGHPFEGGAAATTVRSPQPENPITFRVASRERCWGERGGEHHNDYTRRDHPTLTLELNP